MQAFKINRDSWHYKLNKYFFNEYHWHMERSWEPRHNNFCAYWRATMFRVISLSALTFFVGVILAVAASAVYTNPVMAFYTVLIIIGFIATILGLSVISAYIKVRNKKNVYKPQSLIAQKYHAYKSKICPSVDFKD